MWRILGMATTVAVSLITNTINAVDSDVQSSWDWTNASPESQGMSSGRLDAIWASLQNRQTTAFLIIRNDKIVVERYAPGYGRTKPHYTASMAKALVGGVSLMMAMDDRRITPDDLASKFVPQWTNDPKKNRITVRQLATHTSGIEDAEADNLPHGRLNGWKGDFWKRLPVRPTRSPSPGILHSCWTCRGRRSGTAIRVWRCSATVSPPAVEAEKDTDLRSLLKHRIMEPLGVPDSEWSIGYGTTAKMEGLPLVATWGGGTYSPNAVARDGRLMLHKGNWEGEQLISPSVAKAATTHSGLPGHSGLCWWVNSAWQGSKLWKSAPEDAFGGAGAGHQFLLVVPGLNLIVVRNGEQLDKGLSFLGGAGEACCCPGDASLRFG